jgi:SAM-dependent methyltransferase
MADALPTAEEFWDGFYGDHTWGEHGPVNRHLVSEAGGLPPGTALDLGCGEGPDAIWLAERGWTVTGADVSATALERARDHARRLGLADRVLFEQHDLSSDFPSGEFDLVCAQFLHSPVAAPGEREEILRRAARAVAPGGRLLVVSHWGMPPWYRGMPGNGRRADLAIPTPRENREALRLEDGAWEVLRDAVVPVALTGPDGQTGSREDHVLHARRIRRR